MDETLDVDRPYPSVEKTSPRGRAGVDRARGVDEGFSPAVVIGCGCHFLESANAVLTRI